MASNSFLDRTNVLAALRRRDMLEFIKGSFDNYDAGWVHADICEKLEAFSEAVVRGESPRLMLFMPPRHGKSMILSETFPVWHLGRNSRHNIISASYSADLSSSFSKKALGLAQDDYTKSVFPDFKLDENSQRQNEWNTEKGGGYKSVGVGGSLTGHGANILIIDDPVKDWEDAMSARSRQRVWDWWSSTAYTRLAPGGGVIIIMTRWHEDDLAGRLIKQMEEEPDCDNAAVNNWQIINYPAIATEDEPHRAKGESLHPSRFPVGRLENIRKAVGERVWTSLYQQKPRIDQGRYISRGWFKFIKESALPTGLRWVRGWDLAVTAKLASDHTASSMVAFGPNDEIFIKDQINYKKVWGASKDQICSVARKEKIPIGIESVGAMSVAVEEVRAALRGEILVQGINASTDKLTRALPWIDKAESGKVFLVEGEWNEDFLDQCEAFDPEQSKQEDDRVDSVSIGVEMIRKRRKPRIFT